MKIVMAALPALLFCGSFAYGAEGPIEAEYLQRVVKQQTAAYKVAIKTYDGVKKEVYKRLFEAAKIAPVGSLEKATSYVSSSTIAETSYLNSKDGSACYIRFSIQAASPEQVKMFGLEPTSAYGEANCISSETVARNVVLKFAVESTNTRGDFSTFRLSTIK